jgi:NitT/TauT family transport system substrate-binding protein
MSKSHPTSLTRRRFLTTAAASAAGLASLNLLKAQTRSGKGTQQPVKIGYLAITDSTPLLIAHANKLYEAEGLNAEQPVLFRSWAQISEAFIAGQVNVVHLLSPIAIWLRYNKKFPAKIVAWNHTNGSALTVQPDLKSIKDLGGKTVAVPFWYSIHNIVLQILLRDAGLKLNLRGDATNIPEDEVKLVVLPPPDMISALANRSISAFVVAEPFNAAAENLRIGRIQRFTGDVWQDHACCVVLLKEEDIQQNREWSQRVVNAVVKAQEWLLSPTHRHEAAVILSRESGRNYTPHPLAAVDRVLSDREIDSYVQTGAIKHLGWHEQRIGFQPFPFPSYTEELIRRLRDTTIEGDKSFLSQLDPGTVARDLVDDSLVRTALDQAGGPGIFHLDPSLSRTETILV